MRIQGLTLENFRTYECITLDLTQGDIHLLIGSNGMGKTNLLESISFLSGVRSFLGVEDRHVVQWGKGFFRVRGVMKKTGEEEYSLEVFEEFSPKIRKRYFLNDAPVRLRSFVGALLIVSFLPQDLDLLTGSPGLRRRLLDRVLCQTSGEYLQNMVAYARCLKQRNALLRRIANVPSPGGGGLGRGGLIEELLIWDQEISSLSSLITLERLAVIQFLTAALKTKLSELGLSCDHAAITYERQSTAQTLHELQEELQKLLRDCHERDIRLQATTVGPHRDDWIFTVDEHRVDTWMSRGEQRVCIVALFLLQAEYMHSVRGERAVILLDDVFSELDTAHQRWICKALADHQILITSTHPPPMDMDWERWEVENGTVKRSVACGSAAFRR